MKVLLVSTSSGSRGGGELFLVSLARALAAAGHQPGLFCSTHSRMDELAEAFRPEGEVMRSEYTNTYDYPLRSVHHLWHARASEAIRSAWSAFGPDLIHVNKQNLEDGLDLMLEADRSATPSVSMIHITQTQAVLGSQLAFLRDRVASRCLNACQSPVITAGLSREQDLAAVLRDRSRIYRIENGVEIPEMNADRRSRIRAELGYEEDQQLAVSVGRLEPQKNPMRFLAWASAVVAEEPKARFLWVGDGSLREPWERELQERGLSEHVRCAGWSTEVSRYLQAADVYWHPADFEGQPYALFEAMAHALPCFVHEQLASDLGFAKAEWLVPCREDFGQQALFSDRERLAVIARHARSRAEQDYSMERVARDYLAVYARAGA